MAFGTLSLSDLLVVTQPSIIEFGEDKVFEAIQLQLQAHEALMQEKMQQHAEVTTDRRRRYGGPDSMQMEDVDEAGIVDTQKVTAGSTVEFPLRRKQVAIQWTRDYMETHTPAELAAQYQAAEDADVRTFDLSLRQAIFRPTNYVFNDRFVDKVDLNIKAFVNADGAPLPVSPNGATFDASSHTHYLASATLTEAAVDAVLETVVEHYANGQAMLYINRAQETAIRALPKFTPYLDARIIPGANTTTAQGSLDPNQLYNRAIGLYNGAEVWVKPWIPAGYLFAWMRGAPKPLVVRIRNAQRGAYRIVSDMESFPLRAQTMEREYGVGVWNRTNGAILYIGGGTYVQPTLTA
jgi:hypothetical protein